MRRMLPLLPCFAWLAGCSTPVQEINHPPIMSPVGTGLQASVQGYTTYGFPASPRSSPQSLWDDDRANFFRDPRATRVGDVLTVTMNMDEKATLGNNTDLKNEATIKNEPTIDTGVGFTATPKFDVTSNTESKGTTSIDRSDKINVSVAAVVTDVMPDGNMLISGSQ